MNRRTAFIAAGLMLWLTITAMATPPLTPIEDILFKADATRFTGIVLIEWKSFEASDLSNIATHNLRVRVVNGLLRVKLVPTTTATPVASYSVRYVSDGKVQFSEIWAVPPSAASLRVRDVRVDTPPGGGIVDPSSGGPVQITDVVGLSNELELRPTKGLGYSLSRAAIINATGELESASGAPEDCVRVDGSSGPCGSSGGGGGASFVDGEIPIGILDGVNTTFSLSQTPSPSSSLELYRNGVLQKLSVDFTLSGPDIQFLSASTPQSGDILQAFYRFGTVIALTPQVFCSRTGASSSLTSAASLGACLIPANTLQPGDRVDISFDFTHQGGLTSGFTVEVRWGADTLLSRSVAALETAVTGRGQAAIGVSDTLLSAQGWGSTATFNVGVITAANALTLPLTVDFLGQMAAATTETVTLQQYKVVRYPATP